MTNPIYKFLRKFFFLLNFLVAIYSLLIFQISMSADIKHWLAGFLMLTVPVIFFVNIIFILIYLVSGSWRFLLSLVIMIIGYPLLERTVSYKAPAGSSEGESISILSYNIMYANFWADRKLDQVRLEQAQMHALLDTASADILCFQEFYNKPNSKEFDLFTRLEGRFPYHSYMFEKALEGKKEGSIGLTIFSKYPIIRSKEIPWKINNNGILSCDVLKGEDTLRIMNVQLRSMGVRVAKVLQAKDNERARETKNILGLLKEGFKSRVPQVDILEREIKESPYPVIVAGDFNELPYGYAYGRVDKLLSSAFEKGGRGFGFTYHKVLDFLRIDHIFYNNGSFKINDFETYQHIRSSDHYPVWASLSLRK